jgi:hypothetical protein
MERTNNSGRVFLPLIAAMFFERSSGVSESICEAHNFAVLGYKLSSSAKATADK